MGVGEEGAQSECLSRGMSCSPNIVLDWERLSGNGGCFLFCEECVPYIVELHGSLQSCSQQSP